MKAGLAERRRIQALLASVFLVLSLALAPAVFVKHGPAALAAEVDHRAFIAENGSAHDMAGSDCHDSGDHDHVGVGLLASPGADMPPPPERSLRPETLVAEGTIRDGPRRPPRLAMI